MDAVDEKDEAWELARELVRIDSSDPGAYEGQIERFIKGWLEERIGALPAELASRITIDELEALPGRTELMATIPGTGTEPRLVYICHMDTVTLGEGWSEGICFLPIRQPCFRHRWITANSLAPIWI